MHRPLARSAALRSAVSLAAILLSASPALAGGGACMCDGDLNHDGATDALDLAILLGHWDLPGSADLDGSGAVDAADLAILLGGWGPCETPANDECGAALTLVGDDIYEGYCTSAATTSVPPAPPLACSINGYLGKDLWYRYVAPANGKVMVDTCGSLYDAMLAIYGNDPASECGCPGSSGAYLLGCSDDDGFCEYQASVEVSVDAGDCLAIRIGGYGFERSVTAGEGVLHVQAIHQGDRCDVPHQLPSIIFQTVSGTNANDTWIEGDESDCANGDTIDEWYRFVMPCDGSVTFSTCDPATDFDTTIAVFTGCGGSELACNDDSPDPGCQIGSFNRKSKVELIGVAGEVFLIRVSGYQGAVGSFELIVDVDCIG